MNRYIKFDIFSIALIVTISVFLVSCNKAGKTKNVLVDLGTSSKFTSEEIEAATKCVKEKFKDFEGCELLKLWYDEIEADSLTKRYLENGKGSINGATAENTIVLLSDFKVYYSEDGSLDPNSTYTNWNWILIRDNSSDNWKVDNFGY